MIQRIQTLYMLLTAVVAGLMLKFPLAHYLGDNQEFVLSAFGLRAVASGSAGVAGAIGETASGVAVAVGEVAGVAASSAATGAMVVGTPYMGVLIALATLLPLVAVFLFRRRMLQLRLCVVELVLLLGVQVFVVYYLYHAGATFGQLAGSSVSYTVTAVAPLVGMVLMWLASRGVLRDEYMIRSLDRIR